MKKRFRILLSFLLVLIGSVQAFAQKPIKVRTTILHLVDRTAVGPETTTSDYYAENGGLERSLTKSKESKDKEEIKYTLDEKGNWLETDMVGMRFSIKRELEYNDSDSIVKETSAYGTTEYKYDDNGFLAQKIQFRANGKLESTIDYTYEDRKLIKVRGTSTLGQAEGKPIFLKIDYTYDSAGLLTKSELTKFKGGGFSKRIEIREYKYDAKGRVVSEVQTDQVYYSEDADPAVSYYRIEYSYNPEGHPSRKSYYTEDRRLEKYEEIIYTYYE